VTFLVRRKQRDVALGAWLSRPLAYAKLKRCNARPPFLQSQKRGTCGNAHPHRLGPQNPLFEFHEHYPMATCVCSKIRRTVVNKDGNVVILSPHVFLVPPSNAYLDSLKTSSRAILMISIWFYRNRRGSNRRLHSR